MQYILAQFGNYTYGIPPLYIPAGTPPGTSPPMTLNTRFDMASCSKILGGTTLAASLYQDGYIKLDTKLNDPSLLGPDYGVNGKDNITIRNLLLHNAGLFADPEPSWASPEFGCPEASKSPPAESFNCREQIYNSVLQQKLNYTTGTAYIYSDLSLVTLAFALGNVVRTNKLVSDDDLLPDCMQASGGPSVSQCYFEAWTRLFFKKLNMTKTGWLVPKENWGECAPAENGTGYLTWCVQGQVSDNNAYALGGVAGHAGIFNTVLDVEIFLRQWMFGDLFKPDVYNLFIKEANHSLSSRALGWNTNDPDVNDEGWSLSCGDLLSPLTYMHTGYTGTMICSDPANQFFTILLTNRVYPTDASGSSGIHAIRKAFGDAVANTIKVQQAL